MTTKTDMIRDTRSAIELRMVDRGEWDRLAMAYAIGAANDAGNPRFSRRERMTRWHDMMATASIYQARAMQ